ncbi:hypothetical protein H8356DRAFT_1352805 [Neocallimastix lanati (nom. inval.)]|nr:hypothetical protein H8356DRAFT_1352805 [Neocallimastix sp. JGI-2020a]
MQLRKCNLGKCHSPVFTEYDNDKQIMRVMLASLQRKILSNNMHVSAPKLNTQEGLKPKACCISELRLQLRKFHINDIFEKLKLDKFEIKFLEYYVSFGGFKMVKEVKLESNAFPNRTFRNMAYFCFILAVKAFLVRPLPMPIAWLGFSGKYYTHLIPPISLIQLSSIYTSCRPERVECVWQSFLRGDTQHMVTYENLLILTYRYVMERLSRDPGDCGCKTQLVTVRHRKLDKGSSYKPLNPATVLTRKNIPFVWLVQILNFIQMLFIQELLLPIKYDRLEATFNIDDELIIIDYRSYGSKGNFTKNKKFEEYYN